MEKKELKKEIWKMIDEEMKSNGTTLDEVVGLGSADFLCTKLANLLPTPSVRGEEKCINCNGSGKDTDIDGDVMKCEYCKGAGLASLDGSMGRKLRGSERDYIVALIERDESSSDSKLHREFKKTLKEKVKLSPQTTEGESK